MKKEELAEYNIGLNLDHLMTLDPRGYGVCRILYDAARKRAGEPVAMHAAKALNRLLARAPGEPVYILTGFVLRPHLCPETDGIVGAMMLSRALELAYGVKPVVVCSRKNLPAVQNIAPLLGMHLYADLDTMKALPYSMGVVPFPEDREEAKRMAAELLAAAPPAAVIATEAPGANAKGEYHNAAGDNITELEAKMDELFTAAGEKGTTTFAVGDLGNEIGMSAIRDTLLSYVPYTGEGECSCPCGGGILAATSADYLLTGTCSDWAVYALIAATAWLVRDIRVMHDFSMEERVLREACRSGMVDMSGSLLPGIDGFDVTMDASVAELMRQCTDYALQYENEQWFTKTLEKQYFQEAR